MLIATALAAALLTQIAEAKRVQLTVSSIVLPRDDDMGINGQAQRGVLKAFREKFPDIDVVRSGGATIQGVGIDSAPLMAIAAGISPDVIYVNFRKSDSYIRQGFLYPLDEFMGSLSKAELNEIVLPSVKPVLYREGPDDTEHWWAMPYGNLVIALFYRKDLFRDAGLDPGKPPRNWDELLADARKLTDPEKGIYGIGFGAGVDAAWNWYSFLLSTGARAVEKDAKHEWHAVFDAPPAADAVHFYCQLIQQPYVKNGKTIPAAAKRDADIWTFWNQGKIAMFQDYLDYRLIAQINPEQIGIAPIPLGPTGLRGSEVNSTCMGMYAGIKDPRVRQAAWEFMRFWTSLDAVRIRTRIYVENGFGRFLNPADLRRFGYTEYLRQVPKGWEQVFAAAMRDGVPEPCGKNCDLIYQFMTKPLEQALVEHLGEKPLAEARPRILELLKIHAANTNERMIGIVPPAKLRVRKRVAMVVAMLIVLSFVWAFRYLMRVFTPQGAKSGGWGSKKHWPAYLMLVPALALMFVWQYVPTLRGSVLAFTNYRIMGGSRLVGIENFANVLYDPFFWSTLGHSLYYAGLILLLGFTAPILLAVLLHEVPKGKIVFRVIFYLPAVVSGLIVIYLWKSFYDPSPAGMFNKGLGLIHLPAQDWLGDPHWAMLSVILPLVWAGMGPGSLLYLAALKTIPEDLYEQAEIDGANTWLKFWNVTIPTLKPLIIISFIGAFIGAFKASDFILAMTGGGPADATTVLELQIFYDAFLYLRFGPATAMAWLMGFMLIGFTVYQMKRLSQMQFRSVKDV